jgi:hypothetical protein
MFVQEFKIIKFLWVHQKYDLCKQLSLQEREYLQKFYFNFSYEKSINKYLNNICLKNLPISMNGLTSIK